MKTIAITQKVVENKERKEKGDYLDQRWIKLLTELNYTPLIIPNKIDYSISLYIKNLNVSVDGVVLTGGNDISSLDAVNVAPERDKVEIALIEYSIKRNIPLLGVCRGMQIIGNYFKIPIKKINGHVAKKHSIYFNKNNFYYDTFKDIKQVNSYHSYGILKNDLSDKFEEIANKGDVIEGIRHKKYNITAIMWHPEREIIYQSENIRFLKNIFKLN